MLLSTFFAALAAIPIITAQTTLSITASTTGDGLSTSISVSETTATVTQCTRTHFTYVTTPTGNVSSAVPTTYLPPVTTTNTFNFRYTTRETVTVTPAATTFTNTVNVTTTFTTTTTSIPSTVTVPAPSGFIPFRSGQTPTPIARIKRLEIAGRDTLAHFIAKRDFSGGFSIDEEGTPSDARYKMTTGVECDIIVSVNRTTTTIVTGLPETTTLPPPAATSIVTSTFSTTETVTTVLPTPTIYDACRSNNVVNSFESWDGSRLYFKQIEYSEPIPDTNQLLVNKTSGTDCCIACQTTPNCGASAYVPSRQQCRLLLNEPAPVPSNNTGIDASSTAVTSTSATVLSLLPPPSPTPSSVVNSNTTCARGSMSRWVGTVRGAENITPDVALVFSNGGCGRLMGNSNPLPLPSPSPSPSAIEGRKMMLI